MKCHFSGYATKANVRCSDGREIRANAFKDQDGMQVPLVWQHQKDDPKNVLGHVILENREDGVYAYGVFNDTESGKQAKALVEHGDINSLSIHANRLMQKGNSVLHGVIREVSLVLAGANPGATIDNVCIEHSDGEFEFLADEIEARFYEPFVVHSDEDEKSENEEENVKMEKNDSVEHADSEKKSDKSIKEIFDSMTDEQKEVCYAMIGMALSEGEDDEAEHAEDDEGGYDTVKHNVFEGQEAEENAISHSDVMEAIDDAMKNGRTSLKQTFLEHGIENIDILFPEAKAVTPTPSMIARDQEWVAKVWNATKKSPFSRIKSVAANLTADEARAKGYIKGKKKIEEQFGLLKRITTPQTIYKKQGLDRDDIIDITDMDVVAWMKAEMRMMLNEELARAIMVGDGRSAAAEDKINPINIRPIYGDEDVYVIYHEIPGFATLTDTTDKANAIIDAANYARIQYKGSGSPVLYTDSMTLTTLLLSKDKNGRRLYNTANELASAMRVREIIEVPVMENLSRTVTGDNAGTYDLKGIIVNLNDYTVGADRGGAVSMFDDFDIDYNRYKYLIETRCSGALVVPYSAIVLESKRATVTPPSGT